MDHRSRAAFPADAGDRDALRLTLRQARRAFVQDPAAMDAGRRLGRHLVDVLVGLEAHTVGVYWPMDGEFNAVQVIQADDRLANCTLALPHATREPPSMHYHRWDGEAPTLRDECGIPTCAGAHIVPDLVVVPCVGYTDDGYRLGYGGGYFDRWLAAHPGVTAVGVCWAAGRVAFAPQAHDLPLPIIVTEEGVHTP